MAPTSAQDRAKINIVPNIPHAAWVNTVAFSPDGTRVLSGSGDETIRLWDAATGALLRTFEGHSDEVWSVVFAPDGSRVLSGSFDGTIRLWDAATGALLRALKGHTGKVFSVSFSPDGTRVLAGGDDKATKLWDAATGTLLRKFEGHSGRVRSVAFSPDGDRVLSGSDDKTLKLWDAARGLLLRTLEGHSGGLRSVAFSPDGARVLSGSQDGTIRLWDAATGALLRTFNESSEVRSVAFSPDGTRVLSGTSIAAFLVHVDATLVRLWDAATGQLLGTFRGHSHGITSAVFSPDGTRAVSGSYDKTVRLWDAATGTLLRTFGGNSGSVRSVAFSTDGARILSGGEDKAIRLWDAGTGALLRRFDGHSGLVGSVAFSPNRASVLSGGFDETVRLWDTATGTLLRTTKWGSGGVYSVAFSPDGARLLSGTVEKTIKLWDAGTGALLRTFEGHSDSVQSVAFSTCGTRVLSGSHDKTIKLWDAGTGALLRTFEGHSDSVQSVAFSTDGTRVLSGSRDKTIKLWDAATGALLRTLQGHSFGIRSVAFSPDGAQVLSGSDDNTMRLWDAGTGALLRIVQGHSASVRSVAFSPNGGVMVSGSSDTTVRIWNTTTGTEVAAVIGGPDSQWVAITPGGFFAAWRNSTETFNIVRGLNLTTIDQVHQSLFNPDLVREAIAGDPEGEVTEAVKVINLEKVLDSGPAPSVAIVSPPEGSQSAADLVTVTAHIEDRGKGVGRIEWRVNGVTAAVGAKPAGGGGVMYTPPHPLALDPGDNTIEVVAYNGRNLLASLPARITVKFTGPADKTKPKLHILAIGINAYVDKGWTPRGSKTGGVFPPLDLAVKDAKAFAARMKKAARGLYDKVRVTLVLDQDATRGNLPKMIDKIAAQIHPRDTFILFAAAHGYSLKGRFYLIPQDYQGGLNTQALATRAIGQEQLQDWLANRIKARRAIILLDTCQSGALVAGHQRSRVDAPASEAAVGRLHEATGRPVLTAAAAGQDAIEGIVGADGEKHGVFTSAILDALRKGDANGDGLIELSELVGHVQRVVPKLAAEMDEKQAARFGSRGENFVVAQRLQ